MKRKKGTKVLILLLPTLSFAGKEIMNLQMVQAPSIVVILIGSSSLRSNKGEETSRKPEGQDNLWQRLRRANWSRRRMFLLESLMT